MLTVTYRPEADLYINNPPEYQERPYYTSRWASAHLPLVYKILNTKFPLNSTDTLDTFSEVSDRNGFARFNLIGGSYESYLIGEKVIVAGSNSYNGVYEVKEVVSGEYITLNVIFGANETGTIQRYYDNYSVLVRLYAGVPVYHPFYNEDPITLIGTYAIAPNSDNLSIIDVKDIVRQKISQDNDLNGTGRPNDLNAWTALYIEFAETYDEYTTGIPETFTSQFTLDYLEGCDDIGIINPSFELNLNGWNQNGEGNTNAWIWESGSAKAYVGGLGYSFFKKTNLLYQSGLELKAGIEYTLNILGSYSEATYDKTSSFSVYAGVAADRLRNQIYKVETNLSGGINATIKFTLPDDCTTIGMMFSFGDTYPTGYIKIDSVVFQNTTSGTTSCLAYIFAHNGTRQFFDLVKNTRSRNGGNMAEYVMNYNTEQVLGKFLTRFNEIVFFRGKYLDVSAIVPQSTLDIPYTGDGLILRIDRSTENDNPSEDYEVINYGDGVYRIRIDDKIQADTLTAFVQLVRNQTIVTWLSVLLKDSFVGDPGAYVGDKNDFRFYETGGSNDYPKFVSIFNNGAVLITSDDDINKVFKLVNNEWVLIWSLDTGTSSPRGIKAFDNNNWAAIIELDEANDILVYSKNGVITIDDMGTLKPFTIDGNSIDELYISTAGDLASFDKIRYYKRINGSYSQVTQIANFGMLGSGKVPFRYFQGNLYSIFDNTNSSRCEVLSYSIISNNFITVQLGLSPASCLDISDDFILACTEDNVFIISPSEVQDTDFDAIRATNTDTTKIVSCCIYAPDLLAVLTEKSLYTKSGDIWSVGAEGDYDSNDNTQIAGFFISERSQIFISESKEVIINDECSGQSIYISWMNTLGNWEYWNFTARKDYEKLIQEFTEVRRNIYSNWPDGFSGETEDDKISISAYDRVTVRSQFVTKDQLDIIAEILQSIRVQVWYESESKITVKVDTDSVKKYSDGDKLYAIEFDIIYPMVQVQQQ